MPNGVHKTVKGRTQKVNSYWASLRRCVGEVSINTGVSTDEQRRTHLHRVVRAHQWRWWHLGVERMGLLGGMFARRRLQRWRFGLRISDCLVIDLK